LPENDTLPPFPARRVPGPLARLGAVIETLAAAILVGGLVTTAIVAQIAFRSPDIVTHEKAGLFAGRVFEIFLYVEMGATLFVILGSIGRRTIGKQIAVSLLMLALIAHVFFAQRMRGLRLAAGGSIDRLAPQDPLRAEFGRLHRLYVGASAVMLLAGASILGSTARKAS
jgi:hypothetical protein